MQAWNQLVELPILNEKRVSLFIKREDLIHPQISGNKYRKLKYNLLAAKAAGNAALLTFGGAFSNHLAATAYAGALHGFKTIGVIRGDELKHKWQENPTLKFAHEQGMHLHFATRSAYKNKENGDFLEMLRALYGEFYLLPEGGSNLLAVKGCEEMVTPADNRFDVIACAAGTGATVAGLSNGSLNTQRVMAFSALKGDFLKQDIRKFAIKENWHLITDYHFGGYAKINEGLIDFINSFKQKTNIALDPVYTGKMVYGLLDMVKNDYFVPGTQLLAIHTGGLQGITGMNMQLKKKNLPLIEL